jgi:hypothetical protein
MSGGRWNYQQWNIRDLAVALRDRREPLVRFIEAIAETEHIVDWAESGDTVRRREDGSGAERELYDLWLTVFNEVYDE